RILYLSRDGERSEVVGDLVPQRCDVVPVLFVAEGLVGAEPTSGVAASGHAVIQGGPDGGGAFACVGAGIGGALLGFLEGWGRSGVQCDQGAAEEAAADVVAGVAVDGLGACDNGSQRVSWVSFEPVGLCAAEVGDSDAEVPGRSTVVGERVRGALGVVAYLGVARGVLCGVGRDGNAPGVLGAHVVAFSRLAAQSGQVVTAQRTVT